MLKTLIVLVLAIPAFVYAADPPNESRTRLTITGKVYRACSVTPPSNTTIDLGTYRTSDWTPNYNNLRNGNTDIPFSLTDCDADTVLKITAKADNRGVANLSEYHWFIGNDNVTAPDLHAGIGYVKEDGTMHTLHTDGSNARVLSVSSGDVVTIRLSLRRTNTTVVPVGEYSGAVTVIFTFE